jgi:phosphotriesterase-related protein
MHEFQNGIRNTSVKPGFIKISVDRDSLSHFHTQLIKAAALTHLETGLVIASHTGPYIPAFQQIEILEKNHVSPEAFFWVHAHDEKNLSTLSEAAEKGAWISLDYLNENNVEIIINIIQHLKKAGHLSKILLSHDAGWFDPAKPNGGEFRGFNVLIDKLVPTLQANGFSNKEIELLLIENPANAFQIKARRK